MIKLPPGGRSPEPVGAIKARPRVATVSAQAQSYGVRLSMKFYRGYELVETGRQHPHRDGLRTVRLA
jgi:hypothetical protein